MNIIYYDNMGELIPTLKNIQYIEDDDINIYYNSDKDTRTYLLKWSYPDKDRFLTINNVEYTLYKKNEMYVVLRNKKNITKKIKWSTYCNCLNNGNILNTRLK